MSAYNDYNLTIDDLDDSIFRDIELDDLESDTDCRNSLPQPSAIISLAPSSSSFSSKPVNASRSSYNANATSASVLRPTLRPLRPESKDPPKLMSLDRFRFSGGSSSGGSGNKGSGSGTPSIRQQFQTNQANGASKTKSWWTTDGAQHMPTKKATAAGASGQKTITSMFASKSKSRTTTSSPQQQEQQQPVRRDANGESRPGTNTRASSEIIDLDDLDLDLDALYGNDSDSDLNEQPAEQQQQQQQQQNPRQNHAAPATTTTKSLPFFLKTASQTLPLSRIRGDNSLVEATHRMDHKAMETYIYPLLGGQPARAYQQGAIRRCLFQNTLVALPTGMGKTLIAVVVMANFARWFPDSITVFLAPTKPLVTQQMHACNGMIHAILRRTGVPVSRLEALQDQSKWVVEMNGSKAAKLRSALWKTARFVFSTPQVLQNDLKTGTLDAGTARRISLVVIDEAHRATGKYAYGESISLLRDVYFGNQDQTILQAAPFRVMALTATPGSKISAVQEVVHRLFISHIFLRTEESMDVAPYLHGRRIEEMVIPMPPWLLAARECLANVMKRSINILCNSCGAMQNPGDPLRVSSFVIRTERDRFMSRQYGNGSSAMDKGRIIGEFTVAMMVASAIQLLSEHGLRPAWASLRDCNLEVMRAKEKLAQTTRAKADCVNSVEWTTMMREFGPLVDALDSKPIGTSSRILGTPSAQSTGQQRTDVVSSFFNVSSIRPGGPPKTGQSIVSLIKPGFLGHPKLERLLQVVRDHFSKVQASGGQSTSTRIIVFSQYRGSVSEIVSVLSRLRPQVSCEPFIGQSSSSSISTPASGSRGRGGGRGGGWRGGWGRGRGRGSGGGSSNHGGYNRNAPTDSEDTDDIPPELLGEQGSRGQTQKEQLAVLDRFRNGQTNVIVATCVGEEGLDIGEVDLIINYDAPGSPIRLLQRIGRTGRARRGTVILFLAKDTREENTYKKAQREYKSVQQKIATGKGLLLRNEISPPMVPPGLPTGPPACREVNVSKDDIARAAAEMDHGSTTKTGRTKATATGTRAKRKKQGVGAGVDMDEMAEFVWLANKYRDDSAHGHARSNGFTSAASVANGATQLFVPGSEKTSVSRMLDRGVAWQSRASPSCLVAHTQRSDVYWRIMSGIESARFSHDLGSPTDQSQPSSSKGRFHMPGTTPALLDAGKAYANIPLKTICNEAKRTATHQLAPRQKPKKPKLSLNKADTSDFESAISLISDDDDNDELEDIDRVLSKPATAPRAPKIADMFKLPPPPPQTGRQVLPEPDLPKKSLGDDNAMLIDSSPLENSFLLKLAHKQPSAPPSPPQRSGEATPALPQPKKPASARTSTKRKKTTPASGSTAASAKRHRESSASIDVHASQRNLHEALDKAAKSGRTKRVFNWSMSFDTRLVNDAKAAGVDLALNDPVGLDDLQQPAEQSSFSPESLFENIGVPGAYDKFYDQDQPHSTPNEPAEKSEDMALEPLPISTQELCAASDNGDTAGLPDDSNACHTNSSPPTQPIPESSPVPASKENADEFDMALMDMSIHTSMIDDLVQETQIMIPETPETGPAPVAAESSCGPARVDGAAALGADILNAIDLDMDMLGSDLDAAEILVVSSDEDHSDTASERNGNAATSVQPAQPVTFSSPQSMPRRPARPQFRRQTPPPSSTAEAANGLSQHTGMLPSSSPVRAPGQRRLIRGRPAANYATSPKHTPSPSPKLPPAAQDDMVTPTRSRRQKKRRLRLKRPPQARKKLIPNQFIDNEVEVGDSDNDGDSDGGGDGLRRKFVASADEDEGSREDLDQDLSSFIVDDGDVEYDTPLKNRGGASASQSAADDVSSEPGHSMDFYRRAMHSQGTPVSELMRRLAEREKKRRWVDDTPVRKNQPALMLVGSDDDASDGHSVAGYTDDDDNGEGDQGSSDFERAEDLFTQLR